MTSYNPLDKFTAVIIILSVSAITFSTLSLYNLALPSALTQTVSDLFAQATLDHLLWMLLLLGVFGLIISVVQLLLNKSPLFGVYYHWRRVFPYSIGCWLWYRSVITIIIGATLAGIILWVVTRNPLVSITGFYASILFFERALDVEIPLLKLHKVERTNSNAVDIPGGSDNDGNMDTRAILTVNVENIGSLVAKDYTIEYKSLDQGGEITQRWTKADIPSDVGEDIAPDGFARGIPLDLSSDDIQGTFRLVVRLSPEYFHGIFATYQAIETEY